MQAKKNCNFVHKLYPTQFPENDMRIIKDCVQNTEGFTFHNSVKFTTGQEITPTIKITIQITTLK